MRLHFARKFPDLEWQPSDPSPDALNSIEAHGCGRRSANLRDAGGARRGRRDLADRQGADALLCINMVHISPWVGDGRADARRGRLLASGAAPLILYGPYRRAGVETAPSNEAFDQSLKARNPEWGLRNLEDVAAEAERNGLALERVVEMPANNLTVVFRQGLAP
jgi:hypothetical protein